METILLEADIVYLLLVAPELQRRLSRVATASDLVYT